MQITQAQINTALRYVGITITAVVGTATAIGVLPDDQAHAFVAAFQKLMTDLQAVVGDLYILTPFVLTIGAGIIGKLGWNSARPSRQAAVINARNDMKVLTSNPEIAKESPGVELVPPEVTANNKSS